jgi:hypothetical protein
MRPRESLLMIAMIAACDRGRRATPDPAPAAVDSAKGAEIGENAAKLADLAGRTDDRELELATTGLGSSLARFDSRSAAPWVLANATAWNADAVLERIDLFGVREDGLIDVSKADDQNTVWYWFFSPRRLEASALGAKQCAELKIELRYGIVTAIPIFTTMARKPPPRPAPLGCPIPRILAALRTHDPPLPIASTYTLTLRWNSPRPGVEGWMWNPYNATDGEVLGDTCALVRSD